MITYYIGTFEVLIGRPIKMLFLRELIADEEAIEIPGTGRVFMESENERVSMFDLVNQQINRPD